MIESSDVFSLMKVAYVIYVVIVLSFIGMYSFRLTRDGRIPTKMNGVFYAWVGILIFTGVGIHIMTFNKIPWVKWDLSRHSMKVDKEFNVAIADYQFQLPEKHLLIEEGQTIRFNLESKDYTYGFGLFREDGSMLFQMQVVPGSKNDIVWKFNKSSNYTIRSTEYSGPRGGNLFVKNAVVVASGPALAKLMSQNEIKQN
ncbi:MAG: cytochrome C oxidase subunit II [Nitrospirae bacterium]|nr:cytochrome C oxidase subunit II [Nitrospirota bacterium]